VHHHGHVYCSALFIWLRGRYSPSRTTVHCAPCSAQRTHQLHRHSHQSGICNASAQAKGHTAQPRSRRLTTLTSDQLTSQAPPNTSQKTTDARPARRGRNVHKAKPCPTDMYVCMYVCMYAQSICMYTPGCCASDQTLKLGPRLDRQYRMTDVPSE